MKKFLMLWVPLIVIVLGGVGVGIYFLRSTPNEDDQVVLQDSPEYKDQTLGTVYKEIESTKHLAEYEIQVAALTKLDSSIDVVLFVPSKNAIETFIKDTALDVVKFIPYHVVTSDLPLIVEDGSKLKTEDGQEVVIVKIAGDLYVRDAKGNDARLRKPVQTKNGKIYIIDKVLLTQ
jgi:uncharacterized surface protein with fasciclin (FAS1) repeats